MLYGGFGTLIFFGIGNRTAKNKITAERVVTKTEKTYRTELDVYQTKLRHNYPSGPIPVTTTREISSRPVAWKNNYTCSSQYYDINENLCGTSQSTWTGAELHTTYYDANRHVCGTSISKEKGDDRWETDYYNSDRQHCGTSISRGKSTTYDLLDGRTWDTSESDSYGNTTYISTKQIAENKEKAERERYEQAERKRRQEQEAREKRRLEEQVKVQRKQAEEEKAVERYTERRETAIPSGAVREQVCLLSHDDINVRISAYTALLDRSNGISSFTRLSLSSGTSYLETKSHIPSLAARPGFSDQVKDESASIINIMMKIMTEMKVITNTRYGVGGTEQQNKELFNSLRLFNTLPFERNEVKVIVLKAKIIPFLIKMSTIYEKRDWNDRKKQWDGKFSKEITKILKKIAQIDIDYKAEIARVENLNRDISRLKSYYLSQAGFFNAGGNIFDDEDYDSVVTIMRERGTKNPTGASEKTLQHFGLK